MAYVSKADIQLQIRGHAEDTMSKTTMLAGLRTDSPRDGSIAEVAAVDEREAVDDTTSDDEASVNAMDDLPLLAVGVDGVGVKSLAGGVQGSLFVERISAVGAAVANFLISLEGHVVKDAGWIPHSRHRGALGLYSRLGVGINFPNRLNKVCGRRWLTSPHIVVQNVERSAKPRPDLSGPIGRNAGRCVGGRYLK